MFKALKKKDDFEIIKRAFYLHQKAIFRLRMYKNEKSKKFNGFLIILQGNLKM